MKDIFREYDVCYHQRHGNNAKLPKVRTTAYVVETIIYLCNKLWQLLLHEIKKSATLEFSKNTYGLRPVINATEGYANYISLTLGSDRLIRLWRWPNVPIIFGTHLLMY